MNADASSSKSKYFSVAIVDGECISESRFRATYQEFFAIGIEGATAVPLSHHLAGNAKQNTYKTIGHSLTGNKK